jgi:hypothetical protein
LAFSLDPSAPTPAGVHGGVERGILPRDAGAVFESVIISDDSASNSVDDVESADDSAVIPLMTVTIRLERAVVAGRQRDDRADERRGPAPGDRSAA